MGHDDIDKLLGDEEEEDVEAEGEGADQDPSAGEKPKDGEQPKALTAEQVEALRKENTRLKQANRGLNQKLRAKKDPEPKGEEEDKPDYSQMSPAYLRELAKTDKGAQAWLDIIREENQAAMKPLRDSAYRTALKEFTVKHPEYLSTADGRARFKAVEATAKRNGLDATLDSGSMLDLLNRAHAFENPNSVQAKPDPGRERAKKFATDQAAAPTSQKTEGEDYTEEEMAQAERLGVTPEEARAAIGVYGGGGRVDLT